MSEFKISDFKMLEKAPYEKMDTRSNMELFIRGAKDKEKVYGPAFTVKFIKYALMGASRQTGENPPEDIKTLDQLKEYLISISEKLPLPPYFLLIWAQFVTDKKFEGSQAVGTQLVFRGFAEGEMESDRDAKPLQNADVDQILAKCRRTTIELKSSPLEFGYKKNEDGSIDLLYRGCFFSEGCQMSLNQGLLKRSDGRMLCGSTLTVCQWLKAGTGYEWDYTILEFSKPHCIVRCFTI
nr:hypothetical protein [Candidatus Freyarchaeota archaeon]